MDNQINILDSKNKIFNDICSNFTVSRIDIPFKLKIIYITFIIKTNY